MGVRENAPPPPRFDRFHPAPPSTGHSFSPFDHGRLRESVKGATSSGWRPVAGAWATRRAPRARSPKRERLLVSPRRVGYAWFLLFPALGAARERSRRPLSAFCVGSCCRRGRRRRRLSSILAYIIGIA